MQSSPAPLDELLLNPLRRFPFEDLHAVNERLIELLVDAARSACPPPFALINPLRELLRSADPTLRMRIATRQYLLLEMSLDHPERWRRALDAPERLSRAERAYGMFARREAVPLARVALNLLSKGIQVHPETACLLFGMHEVVAALIAGLAPPQLDRLAERAFRELRPRWADRPSLWRALILAAKSERTSAMREFDLQAMALLSANTLKLPKEPSSKFS